MTAKNTHLIYERIAVLKSLMNINYMTSHFQKKVKHCELFKYYALLLKQIPTMFITRRCPKIEIALQIQRLWPSIILLLIPSKCVQIQVLLC